MNIFYKIFGFDCMENGNGSPQQMNNEDNYQGKEDGGRICDPLCFICPYNICPDDKGNQTENSHSACSLLMLSALL